MKEINARLTQDARKLAYLSTKYPKPIKEMAQIFNGSILDFNTMVWYAEDTGLISLDQKTGEIKTNEVLYQWDFGEEVRHLTEIIPYALKKFAESESDLEDNYFSNWTQGYYSQDILTAVQVLIDKKIVATYKLTTEIDAEKLSKKAKGRGKKPKQTEQTYTFYTLTENLDKQWGRKMFPDQSKLK